MLVCLGLAGLGLAFARPAAAAPAVLLQDNFTNTNYVDMKNTTAYVDTTDHWVQLPQEPEPDAIALKEQGYERTIATASGILTYDYTDQGTLQENSYFSVTSVTDSIGVALQQNQENIWSITPTSLTLYSYSGSGMTQAASATGLTGVLSVAAWENAANAVVLTQSSGGTGVLNFYRYAGGALSLIQSTDTGLADPVAVSLCPGTPDVIIGTTTGAYMYAYNDATGQYAPDPNWTAAGLTGQVGLSGFEGHEGFVSMTSNAADWYFYNDANGQATLFSPLSESGLNNPIALATKAGTYQYAILTGGGAVKYYTYDDATGQMAEWTAMEQTGLSVNKLYQQSAVYQSVAVSTGGQQDDEVSLTATMNNDPNTTVTFYVSSDGGNTWTPVTPDGTWIDVPPGDDFVVKADLQTTDQSDTPRITSVTLEADTFAISNLQVTAIVDPPPQQTNPLPTSIFPVYVEAGAQFVFTVDTSGDAQGVTAVFSVGGAQIGSVSMTPQNSTASDDNVWTGTFVVPVSTAQGTLIDATLTASRPARQVSLSQNPMVDVEGTVSTAVQVELIK